MKYAQKWADRISGEFVSKYTVFSHKGGVRTSVVNPKDLNKDRGLTKMSPLFLFTLLIPEIIVHDVSFAFIRVKQVKYSLFHGRWAAEVPNQTGLPKICRFLGRGGIAIAQCRRAAVNATSAFRRGKDSAWFAPLIGRNICSCRCILCPLLLNVIRVFLWKTPLLLGRGLG